MKDSIVDTAWKLALEQAGNFDVIQGSIAEVAAAVRNGADLRLLMTAKGYEETLYFQQTYAGEGHAFAGLMTHHHSYAHRGSLAEQPYFSFFKYDAFGPFSQVKWMLDNATFDEQQPYEYGIYRWFVNDCWRVVYHHDADGRRIDGDLDEFTDAIRNGLSVKVGVKQFCGIDNDDATGPEHFAFLDVMQPLIKDGHAGANCDFALTCAPKYPFAFRDGLSLGMVWPWTSGEIICHFAKPGKLPFQRSTARREIKWLVAK